MRSARCALPWLRARAASRGSRAASPIIVDDQVIGAIGVSSGTSDEGLSGLPSRHRRIHGRSKALSGWKTFEEFKVGDKATFSKTITDADLLMFVAVSGDQYEVHVDEEYAKTTRFGKRIAHGMLTASLISAVNGALLQRPGGISVAQTLHWKAPVYPGDTLTATSEVVEIITERRRLRCRTTVVNQNGVLVLDGEAIEQKDTA
jgi:3-hydroxybutyryl-CoA dehydratase